MMKIVTLIFAFVFFSPQALSAQEFMGIDFRISTWPNDTFGFDKQLTIDFYLKSKDTVLMDTFKNVACFGWENLPKTKHFFFQHDIQLLRFEKKVLLIYLSSNLCWTDSIIVEGINNYNNGEQTPIQFNTDYAYYPYIEEDAVFNSLQTEAYFEDGVFHFDASGVDPNGQNLGYYLDSAFQVGDYNQLYSLPVGSDTIRIDPLTGAMSWDRPTVPGKYLIIIGYAQSFAPIPPSWGTRQKRYMIIEVKPQDIVSKTNNPKMESGIRINPNPTKDKLHISIELNNPSLEGKLTIFNFLGQIVYFESVKSVQNKIQWEINVSHFKAGVYLLSYEDYGQVRTEKIIVY